MSYSAFRTRMNVYGGSIQNSTSNITKHSARKQIINSPTRKEAFINDSNSDVQYCLVNDVENIKIRRFLFLPDTVIYRGDYIYYNDFIYLTIEQSTNEEYPQVKAELCSSTFTYSHDEEKLIVDYDDMGRPVYDQQDKESITLPCIVKMSDASTAIADANESVNLLDNIITVTIPYGKVNNIKYDAKFNMFGDVYRIIRIDPSNSINGIGLLKITGERLEEGDE